LELNDLVFEVGGGYWVKIIAMEVEASCDRPHGIHYSLTLHAPDGERIIGFDNAHSVEIGSGPAKRKSVRYDHVHHRNGQIEPYEFESPAQLVEDFWNEVDTVLRERGVL
jgi:hypothetical protein